MTDLLKEHDIHIRVFNCMPYRSGGGRGLLRLSSNEKLDVLIDKIRAREEVLRISFNRVSNRAVMGEVVIDKCAARSALKQSDCFMISSKSRNDKWLEWAVAAESNSMIHACQGGN